MTQPTVEDAARLPARRPARGLAALGCGLLAAALAQPLGIVALAEPLLFDAQVRIARALGAPAAARFSPDVVLVGIDEASAGSVPEPLALQHELLGATLQALAAAQPRLIALDAVLPTRSFDAVKPGLDEALMRGLVAAREAGGVVFVIQPDANGRLVAPHPPFVAAAGHGAERPALGVALLPLDADGVVRRFDPALGEPSLPTFVGAIAQRLGLAPRVREGWIDFTRGAPFAYVPLIEVVRRHRAGDETWLRGEFAGRIVLVGSVLPYLDRHRTAVDLVGWEYPATPPPGVILHAQALRSLTGNGFVAAAPLPLAIAVAVLLAAVVLLARPVPRAVVLLALLAASFGGATAAHASGVYLPLAAGWFGALTATGLRGALELGAARRERERLVRTFGGYVSPQLLHAIVSHRVGTGAGRRDLALLFADLRGFTAWSEKTAPQRVLAELNRYYAAITPVLHRHGGTIDNFRGDGVMVMFGAPQPLAEPCAAAFAAACELFDAVAELNRQGPVQFDVAVGLAFGDAVFGDLGSEERKDFTALGDAVNVAARLQDLAKTVGYPLLLTDALLQRLPAELRARQPIVELGPMALKGHSPVAVAGCRVAGAA